MSAASDAIPGGRAPEKRVSDLERELTQTEATGERLQAFVAQCRTRGIFDRFDEADRKAQKLQRTHRWTVGLSVFFGSVALAVGLVQMAWHEDSRGWAPAAELVSIVLAVVCVTVGYLFEQHEGWLLWRYKAERYRQLVFENLVHPQLWRSAPPTVDQWTALFEPPMDRILLLKKTSLPDEACEEPLPLLATLERGELAESSLPSLVDFYRRARIESQKSYFNKKAHQDERLLSSPRLVPLIFLLSVIAVVLHLALEAARKEEASLVFLFVAALLPVLLMALKTWKAAVEYSRNASRAKAKVAGLSTLAATLSVREPARLFSTLAVTEALLASEQREWLRLMIDAEWI